MRLRLLSIALLCLGLWSLAQAAPFGTNNAPPVGGPPPPVQQQVFWLCSGGTANFQKSPCTASAAISDTSRTAINTFVTKLDQTASTAPVGATTITVGLYVPVTASGTLPITSGWVGYAANTAAGSGNCTGRPCSWDFALSPAPVQLKFPVTGSSCASVANSRTFSAIATRSVISTCSVAFDWSAADSAPLMVAFDISTGTGVNTITAAVTANTMVIPPISPSFVGASYNCWRGSGLTQSGTTPKSSGYTTCASTGTNNSILGFIQSVFAL